MSKINILMISSNKQNLDVLASTLDKHEDISVFHVDYGTKALEMVSDLTFNLAVIDEKLQDMSGLEFAEQLVKTNPMINCALVSGLSHEDFHEATEGMGILAQISVCPQKDEAEKLLLRLKEVIQMTTID